MAADVRRRLLPAWMGATRDDQATAAPAMAEHCRHRETARPRAASALVYCMNEAELLHVALSVLSENVPCEEGERKARCGSEEEQQCQPTPVEAPGSTAEGSNHSPVAPCPADAGADTERTVEDSDDCALKYVREIFFS